MVFNSYLFHALSFSKDTNLGTEIGRSFYIFTELAKKKELYKPNEFLDFNTDFLNKYGYSIEEYLAVTFGLLNLVLPQPIPMNVSWVKSRHKLFQNSKLKKVAPKIIQDLSLDMDEAKEWSKDTIDNSWNFTKFQEKPLLKLNQEEFIPLNYDVLANGLFDGLYHKIRHCYPLKDTRFPTFFGKPFEKYIEVIIEEAISNSRLPYSCIHEFNYGGKNNTLSSDLYLQLNKNLIIFEAKGARPTLNSTINGIKDSIQNDLKKLYIKPILQANNTFQSILKTKYSTIFDGVENIYIISVNINNIPPVPDLYTKVDENLKGKLHPKVKGYFNFSISDIEAMCYLIARKGKKPPVFKYLNRMFNSPEIQSFSWFLHHSHIPIKRSPWINRQLYRSYESLYSLSFENTEEPLKDLKKLLKD